MRKKLSISMIVTFLFLVGAISTISSAHGIVAKYASMPNYARTTTSSDFELTYNNYLYAETLAWSRDSSGNEVFHQGPKVSKYNTNKAESTVNVPWGRGTWYECNYQGNCNRCGEVLGKDRRMFAF